jgi:hypothetical protein
MKADAVDRVARWAVVVASVWFAFTAVWGMFGIPGGGHIGAGNAGTLMAAEQIVRWKIMYPARVWYTGVVPEPANYMCHHPYGQYYVPALLYWLFGHHDFMVHLPAIPMSAAIPPLLYGIGKETKGPSGAVLGAIAAVAYVVVPIAVGFSSFWNLETICIFGALLFFWGHSRHMTTGRRRYLAASLAGLVVVCSGDWVGYLIVAPTLLWAFLRAFALPARLSPRFRRVPYARWWALSVVVAGTLLLFWVGLFQHAGQLPQWLGAADYRGGGKVSTLQETLASRRGWIDFSFTPLAIAIGKVAAPVCLLRALITRRDEETYVLGFLFGGVVQYVTFKGGADVHIFWPHYFAAYFALALAQLAGSAGLAVGWVTRRASLAVTPAKLAAVTLATGLIPSVALAHDGVTSLWVWRRTGGRYDEKGTLIRSHVDMLYVIQAVLLPRIGPGTKLDVHPDISWGWEFLWKVQAQANTERIPVIGAPHVDQHPFWIARGSGLSAEEQRKIASIAHVRIYGDAWVVDQREAPAPLDAYALEEREPNPFEWLIYGGTEPMRSIGASPDPWTTWEWRVHLGQDASAPGGEPVTLDQIRIAHNVAVANGDGAAAAKWQERIERELDRRVATRFTRGARLLGVRLIGGVEPREQNWFEYTGDQPLVDATFAVRSTVEARATLSLIPPDQTDRDMAFPPLLPTPLWRRGFIYSTEVVLNHRIGRERYWGAWQSHGGGAAPQRADNLGKTTLVVVP